MVYWKLADSPAAPIAVTVMFWLLEFGPPGIVSVMGKLPSDELRVFTKVPLKMIAIDPKGNPLPPTVN